MHIAPYIGTFWVVEGMRPDMTQMLVAIGTSRDELIDWVGNLDLRYRREFIAFKMQEVGGTLLYIDQINTTPTHPAPTGQN
jgi:hypothetical protein